MIEQTTFSEANGSINALPNSAGIHELQNKTTNSPIQQGLYDRIRKTASINSTVLITGESGTGKTTIARMIHEQSCRKNGPFITVNCAALPRDLIEAELFGHKRGSFTGAIEERSGCFEAADGGTLFLDEIGDLPLDLQPKILTVIQDRIIRKIGANESKKVDVRLVVATLQDLGELCQRGNFREDLFYRLNVLQIKVPPLRDRKSEFAKFVQNLLTKIAVKQNSQMAKIDSVALQKLQQHNWPGNIRELENVLERASAFCASNQISSHDIIIDPVYASTCDIPTQSNDSIFHGKTLAEIEKLAILATLEFCDGNKALTARTLGISEKSIYNKMKRLQIKY